MMDLGLRVNSLAPVQCKLQLNSNHLLMAQGGPWLATDIVTVSTSKVLPGHLLCNDRLSVTLQEARPHRDGNLTEPRACVCKLTLCRLSLELLISSLLAQFVSVSENLLFPVKRSSPGTYFMGIMLVYSFIIFQKSRNL